MGCHPELAKQDFSYWWTASGKQVFLLHPEDGLVSIMSRVSEGTAKSFTTRHFQRGFESQAPGLGVRAWGARFRVEG